MAIEENVYKTIQFRSNSLIKESENWKKPLSAAKNYITTPDLNHWTFGKSAGLNREYFSDGGMAKKWLYSIGFVDILQLPDNNFKNRVVNSFSKWASKVKSFDILDKFNKDQRNNKRFEILVHSSVIPKKLLSETNISEKNQELFTEGFKIEVVQEINLRSRSIVNLAKLIHGTQCVVCEFDFGIKYGTHGEGFIEMHHLNPISAGKRKTSIKDLIPVCANCHRMLHKGNRLLDIQELKDILKNANSKLLTRK